MQKSDNMSDKKKSLLEYKRSLLNRIRVFEESIKDVRSKHPSTTNFTSLDDDSSDSDNEPTQSRAGPTLSELQLDCSQLSVCLQATQELTSLLILESEVNVLVDPQLDEQELRDVPPGGTWREVTAECRLDLVPFSITFYVHEAAGRFPSRRYRRVAVACVKRAHAAELQQLLRGCCTPSDAVQAISNYSKAARSRRASLAALSRDYGAAIRMEALPEGGYGLRCAGLLYVEWALLNKGARLSPFHHRLKFNLDPIEETYVKQIRQLHKRLSEPTLETEERTVVLAKIIEICMEVGQSNVETSDTESLNKSRATVDHLPDVVTEHSRVEKSIVDKENGKGNMAAKESALMAPPKEPPKRNAKRPMRDVVDNAAKKPKPTEGARDEKSVKDSEKSGKVKVQSKDAKKLKDDNKAGKDRIVDGKESNVKETVASGKVAKTVESKDGNAEKVTKKIASKDANKENGKNAIKSLNPTEKTKKPNNNLEAPKVDKVKKVTDVKRIKDSIKPTKTLQEKVVQKDVPKATKLVTKTKSVDQAKEKPVEKILSGNRAPELNKNNPKTDLVKRSISSTSSTAFKSKIPRSKLPLKVQNRGTAVFKKPDNRDPRVSLKTGKVGETRHSTVRSSPRSQKPPFKPRKVLGF